MSYKIDYLCSESLPKVLEIFCRLCAYGCEGLYVARGLSPRRTLSSLLRSMYGLASTNSPADASRNPNQTPQVMSVRRIRSCSEGSRSLKRVATCPAGFSGVAAGAAGLFFFVSRPAAAIASLQWRGQRLRDSCACALSASRRCCAALSRF